jgi:hypothetical protein
MLARRGGLEHLPGVGGRRREQVQNIHLLQQRLHRVVGAQAAGGGEGLPTFRAQGGHAHDLQRHAVDAAQTFYMVMRRKTSAHQAETQGFHQVITLNRNLWE